MSDRSKSFREGHLPRIVFSMHHSHNRAHWRRPKAPSLTDFRQRHSVDIVSHELMRAVNINSVEA